MILFLSKAHPAVFRSKTKGRPTFPWDGLNNLPVIAGARLPAMQHCQTTAE
jgi:hypothetical protein